MSSSELSLSSNWSSASERMIGLLVPRAIVQQTLGRSVLSASEAAADERAGGVWAGAVRPVPPRRDSPEHATAAASRRPTGSASGGSGSRSDDDDALLAAPSRSPSPGLTAEMALSILVDCFGH